MKPLEKYTNALNTIPAPGGSGCHSALLGVATLGVMAGLNDSQIKADLSGSIPPGGRKVPESEITNTIKRARMDTQSVESGSGYKPKPLPPPPQAKVKPAYLSKLIHRGQGYQEADFWEASPVRLYNDPAQDADILLRTLYKPDDALFLGERYSTKVKTAAEWLKHIAHQGTTQLPHIIPNPVTGQQHTDKSGNLSYRCDNAIKDFRLAVVEFDNLSRADQLAFWAAVPLPIVALIDSGNKSIHGWIAVTGVATNDEWTKRIETELYAQRLVPLGVDPMCRTEARLSRLPGHLRTNSGRMQKLLYLNPHPTSLPIISKI